MTRWCSLLLVLFSLQAQAQFQLTPPPGRTIAIPARDAQLSSREVAAASDGTEFLVALSDDRFGDIDVLGLRFDESGEPVGGAFPIAATSRLDSVSADPLWNGTDYVVFANAQDVGTYRQQVHRDGSVVSVDAPLPALFRDVAWTGSRYLALEARDSFLRLRSFDVSLQSIGETEIASFGNGWIAAGGSSVLVVRGSRRYGDPHTYELSARLFDEHGVPLTDEFFFFFRASALPPVLSDLTITWNGTRFLVAWPDDESIQAAFISPTGGFERLRIPGQRARGASIDAAWDGLAHLIAWTDSDSHEARAARLASDGTLIEIFDLGMTAERLSVASNGEIVLVVTEKERVVVRSTGAERVSVPKPLSFVFAKQSTAAMTANASSLFVAWEENHKVFASRLSPRGAPLDGRGIEIGSGWQTPISVASTHDTHVVVWRDRGQQRFARVTNAGEVLDPMGGVSTEGTLAASNGTSFLLAGFRPQPAAMFQNELTLTVVPARGPAKNSVSLDPFVFADTPLHSLVRLGDAYALVWTRYLDYPCSMAFCTRRAETRVSLIADDGTPLRSAAIAPYGQVVAAASDGNALLIAFVRGREIFVRRVESDLVAGPETFVYLDEPAIRPQLTATPNGFLFAFSAAVRPDNTAPHVIRLRADGTRIAPPEVVGARAFVSDVIHAFGSTWMTVERAWQPLPESHPGAITRIYLEELAARRRAVTP